MTPEQAQQARQHALQEIALGLGRLSSYEVDPSSTQASALLYDYQRRLRQIEDAEGQAARQRHTESQAAVAHERWRAGANLPGAQPLNRGEAGPRPLPGSREEQIEQVMEEMRTQGHGRI
jgi:hypothetical protein